MKIVVLADSGWDYTYVMKEDGKFPHEPTFSSPGFKGANQAVAAARAGASVSIISFIGDDENGEKLLSNFKNQNVNIDNLVVLENTETDHWTVWVDLEGDNKNIGSPKLHDNFSSDLINKNEKLFKSANFIITTACLPKEALKYLVKFCTNNKIDIIFTPCYSKTTVLGKDEFELFKKMKYIIANEKESLRITGSKSIEEAVKKLPNLIATKGADGVYFMVGNKVKHFPAIPVEDVIDTTGAGDTFCGFFAASMANGNDFITSIKRGLVASSLKIKKRGAQISMPTKDEVSRALSK